MEPLLRLSSPATGVHLRRPCPGCIDSQEVRDRIQRRDRAQSARAQCPAQGLAQGGSHRVRRAGRPRDVRGRSVVALVLTGFVLVAAGVIWRRSLGTTRARAQQRLEQERAALEAERAKLAGDIREAASRSNLARVAEERLKLRMPSDSQVVVLKRERRKRQGG